MRPSLLQDSAALFERHRFGTAVGIGMLAREELGRARILLRLADDVHHGRRTLTRGDLKHAIGDHVVRQTAGQFITGFSTPPRSQLSRLVDRAFTDAPTPESKAALKEFHEAIDRIARKAPQQRHGARLRALYVDPDESGTGWLRPASFPHAEALRLLLDAANHYAMFPHLLEARDNYEWVRVELQGWSACPDLPAVPQPSQFAS